MIGFIGDRCEFDPAARTKVTDVRQAMKVGARNQGVRGVPADNTLIRKLEGLELVVRDVNGYPRVYGLRLKP